jgi:hypothetical protein
MENLIEKRDELIRQITFLNVRESELNRSCTEKGEILAQIHADIDSATKIKNELLLNLKDSLDEIKTAQESIVSLIDEVTE